jgi:hypothetical protein
MIAAAAVLTFEANHAHLNVAANDLASTTREFFVPA